VPRQNPALKPARTRSYAFTAWTDQKLDKLNIYLSGVKGRVRKVEEAIESIARVMSDGAFG
jgi:hypothetical protein